VREAEKHIEHNRVFEALQNLTLHSKLVVLSVFHICKTSLHGAITGEIFEVYVELCSELGVAPLTQRRLSTLVNELDVMGIASAKIVNMGRYGRTKKIRLEIMRTIVKEVFSADARVGCLVHYEPKCIAQASSGKK
jgi:cell division control protein 6